LVASVQGVKLAQGQHWPARTIGVVVACVQCHAVRTYALLMWEWLLQLGRVLCRLSRRTCERGSPVVIKHALHKWLRVDACSCCRCTVLLLLV
jgi:hypothetical protein